MGLLLILALGIYGFVSALAIMLIARFLTKNIWVIGVLVITAVLIPTYDIIITNILGTYYCSQEPNPKTFISKKVEYPESIYWEDNVYPGFSKEDRALMIVNYLDGKHLKTMALNGDDGKVYVYKINAEANNYQLLQTTYTKEHERLLSQIDYQSKSKEENENLIAKNKQVLQKIDETINNYVDSILYTQEIYTKETMPKMNYTVMFDEVKLNAFSRKFLYSDETKIIDNQTGENIAYNRRVMRFFYNAFPDVAKGNIYYYPTAMCGASHLYYDGDGFKYIGYYGSAKHKKGEKGSGLKGEKGSGLNSKL